MKKLKNNKLRIISVVLVLILAILAYMYFVMLKSGGGIVSAKKQQVGNMEFLFSIYGPGRGDRPRFKNPLSVATDHNNNIYVSDTGNDRVAVFDNAGNFKFEFGSHGVVAPAAGEKATWKPGTFGFVYGIDVDDETGNIYVADMTNGRIQIFDNSGKFVDWFPKKKLPGTHTASDIFPTDIAVRNNKVYVCNPYQVVIFDKKGKMLQQIGMPGDTDDKKVPRFDRPNGIDAAPDGTIYVSDSNNTRVMALKPDGQVKWIVGKPAATGASITQDNRMFGLPRNLTVGPDGNVYVADPFHFQIKVFSPEGKQLAAMGQQGEDDGAFSFPNGIAMTKDKIIYVVEKGSNRVQALRLLKFEMQDPLKM